MEPFRAEVVERLRQHMSCLEGVAFAGQGVSTGIEPLDELLPHGGWRPGTLVEWLGEGAGSGAATLALAAARPFFQLGGALVVVDEAEAFYPPVLASLGIALESTIIVRPKKTADKYWAIEQALRCPGVAITFASAGQEADGEKIWAPSAGREMRGERREKKSSPFVPRPSSLAPRPSVWRRLQLAAEAGGGLGIMLRPAGSRDQPTWAHVRLLVRAVPSAACRSSRRRVQVDLLHARGGKGEGRIDLEVNDETGHVRVVAALADPASTADAAGLEGAAAAVVRTLPAGRLPGARLFAPSRRPGDQTGDAARGSSSAG